MNISGYILILCTGLHWRKVIGLQTSMMFCGLNYSTVSEFLLFFGTEASEGVHMSLPGGNKLHPVFSFIGTEKKVLFRPKGTV